MDWTRMSNCSMNHAKRGQKRLLVLINFNLHYSRLSPLAWEGMFFAAEGQPGFHPMPAAEAPELRTGCRLADYSGLRPDASTWISQPGQSAHFLVTDR